MKTKPATTESDPLEKPTAELSESRISNNNHLSTVRDPVNEANNKLPTAESSNHM